MIARNFLNIIPVGRIARNFLDNRTMENRPKELLEQASDRPNQPTPVSTQSKTQKTVTARVDRITRINYLVSCKTVQMCPTGQIISTNCNRLTLHSIASCARTIALQSSTHTIESFRRHRNTARRDAIVQLTQ